MVTQVWLLRFQMCAGVNRIAVPHLRLRHHHGKSKMPRVVTITDGAKSVGDNITINSRIRWRHHGRRSIRIETRHRQNPLLFSTFGFATANPECRVTSQSQTSQIFRRQLHAFTSAGAATIAVQLASKRNIAKSATRATGRIRRNESASFKYASIRCYRSNSRYQ